MRNVTPILVIALAGVVATALGSDTFEGFESLETSWIIGHFDCPPFRVAVHERQFVGAHSGRGCEVLHVVAGQGTEAQIFHRIPAARVIKELQPSVWIKADRRGPQLMARVVFPRSPGKDGKPLSTFVHGDAYQEQDTWRQLRIENLVEKLQREVRVLRSRPGVLVDEREAYIDMLVLNVYAGAGTIRVRLDDLELAGYATAGDAGIDDPVAANSTSRPGTSPAPSGTDTATESDRVQLQGNVLVARGHPLFVRAVEHQGETFAFLQSLGFNAVVLASPPTDAQLDQARRADVWIIAPPPLTADSVAIDERENQVLAWHLGSHLSRADEDRVSRIVREIRAVDPQRPLLMNASSGWSRFRFEDTVMLLEHSVIGSSFELQDFGPWLAYASQHGRSGAAYWASIPTQFPRSLRRQVALWDPSAVAEPPVDPAQVRQMAFEAVSRGARGLWYQSRNRLDGKDAATRFRALSLQALNQELELVAPWVAAGIAVGETNTSNPRIRVSTLQTERARLLIATRQASDQQFVPVPAAQDPVSFVVHGMQPSDQAYRVAVESITPVTADRGGGIRITLDATRSVDMVLLTQDPFAVNYVGRVSSEIRRDYALRQCEVLQWMIQETEAIERQLIGRGAATATAGRTLDANMAQIRGEHQRAARLSESGDARNAIPMCARTQNSLCRIRRTQWELAVLPFPGPMTSPLCTSYSTLPLHHFAAEQLAASAWTVNVLAAGEMESLEHLLDSGWRQDRAKIPGLDADVRLSLDSPRAGRSALQSRVWKTGNGSATTDGEWPITLTSAPFTVREGQMFRMHGWVKVPQPIEGSWDGLMIFDSQTGIDLAERISQTQGWREFTLYRVAPETGEVSLVFAHTGIGEVWLDDISVQINERFHSAQRFQPSQ